MSAPRTVRIRQRRIEVDGVPRLVLAGEVHYFRLPRARWRDTLRQAADAGVDTIATYIPWIWHELPDDGAGEAGHPVDLTGSTIPERDVVGYLELCAEEGFDVIARPGPFVMAELMNEGIPYRVRRDTPTVGVTGWGGAAAPTESLDYLAPAFLAAVRGWYGQVLPPLVDAQASNGGPVIAMQLDNEVGMLDWVTNTPQLTDVALAGFASWRADRGLPTLTADDIRGGLAGARGELALHHELGMFSRDRFADYLQLLEGFARDSGIEVPLLVNVHGTGGGRGTTFPIGVSQLAPAYRGRPGVMAGSDYYLGDLDVGNVADLYLSNAILIAVNGPDQPASSLEFEAGTGDYGEDLDTLYSPESVQLKTVLTLAQGNRMLNYYLLSGGENPVIDKPDSDGSDRMAFTGQRHGFAAPISPEGPTNRSFDALAAVLVDARSHGELFASGTEEHDDIAYGFVADHYLTEYAHPDAAARAEQRTDAERFRFGGLRDGLGRALVLGGWRFPAIDLQAAAGDDDWARGAVVRLDPHRVLVLATGYTLGAAVQRAVASFVTAGGRLLLVGELPDLDDDGTPCTVLADALGVGDAGRVSENGVPGSAYHPTVIDAGILPGTAETRVIAAQLLAPLHPERATVLATERGSGSPVVVEVSAGAGRAIVVGCDYPAAQLAWWAALLERLGASRGIRHDAPDPGIVATTVRAGEQRMLVALNVAPYALAPRFTVDGVDVGAVPLHARGHAMIPLPVSPSVSPSSSHSSSRSE